MKKQLLFLILISSFLCVNAQFGPKIIISKFVGDPFDTKLYDLDSDGDLDVLTNSRHIDTNEDKVVWYENLGGGIFGVEKLISYNVRYISTVFASDLDGDGDLDVLTASNTDNKVAWYENIGNGVFGPQKIISINANSARCAIAVDLDNDGDNDVVSASTASNKIAWYENNGNGIFSSEQIISSLANQVYKVYAEDLDNDGDFDLISADFNTDQVSWYENLGGGTFGVQQVISTIADGVADVFSADLDNDGLNDVLSASLFDDKIAWYKNLGGGSFGTQQIIGIENFVRNLHAADIDNDGDIDVLSFGDLYENLGGGIFSSAQNITTIGGNEDSMFAGDINNDGKVDIVYSGAEHLLYHENYGGNSFGIDTIASSSGANNGFATADLDNDGDEDLIAYGPQLGLVWYDNIGNDQFGVKKRLLNIQYGSGNVFTADVDMDGDIDILYALENNSQLGWFENLGGGNFAIEKIITSTSPTSNNRCRGFAVDIDGDGDPDVLSSAKGIHLDWHENTGGTIDTTRNTIASSVANGIISIYGADMDGDTDNDVVFCSDVNNKIFLVENLGGGIFGPVQTISNIATSVWVVKAVDVDNDGDNDIVAAGALEIAWYENLGAGVIDTNRNLISGVTNTYSISINDVDQDGDLDILSVNSGGPGIYIHENLGAGNFGIPVLVLNSNLAFNPLHSADLNLDGFPDIITGNNQREEIYLFNNLFNYPYKINGNLFYDSNQNGNLDSLENPLYITQTNLSPIGISSYTNSNGKYVYAVDTGTYVVNYQLNSTLWNLTTDSLSYTPTITTSNPIKDSLNFGFYPDTIVTIITPDLIGGFPRCNTNINYWINIHNDGTQISKGIIQLILDDSVDYVGSAIPPDSINGKKLYWHYDSLYYTLNHILNLTVNMPPFTSIGDTLRSILNVWAKDSSGNTLDYKSDTLNQFSVCAYDPNDKTVIPKGLGGEGFILNNQELEYLIRFQNTGNDTAITIVLRDQLDVNLDLNSLQILSSSHSFQASINQLGEAVFEFYNIMLPDSGADELGSHGFIKYKIDMKPNLASGIQIKNKCDIYFDSNPPIITNNVINTIYDCDKLSFNLNYQETCLGETINGWAPLKTYNNYLWELDTFYSSTTNTLNWSADSVGMFNLKLSISNLLCSKDSTLSIKVLPKIPLFYNNQSICQGDSIILGGVYQTSAGSYFDTLQSYIGCDSILNTILSINAISSSNQNQSICQGDSILLGGIYQTSPGNYNDTLQSYHGCDSVIDVLLSVNPVFSSNQNDSICFGDSLLIYGNYQSTVGVYYDSLQTIVGCDSILSTTLTVNPQPNVAITPFNPDSLCQFDLPYLLTNGSPSGGIYSGFGVTSNNFNPALVPGSYYISYTYTDSNSCTSQDSTVIKLYICVGIDEFGNDLGILIYPNPNTGEFTIEKPFNLNKEVKVKVLDATSKLIIDKTIPVGKQKIEIDITKNSNGIYYLQLIVEGKVFVKQILKQ